MESADFSKKNCFNVYLNRNQSIHFQKYWLIFFVSFRRETGKISLQNTDVFSLTKKLSLLSIACLISIGNFFFCDVKSRDRRETLIIAVILKSNQYEGLHYFLGQVTEKSGIIWNLFDEISLEIKQQI